VSIAAGSSWDFQGTLQDRTKSFLNPFPSPKFTFDSQNFPITTAGIN
jgi:hypothetical protein